MVLLVSEEQNPVLKKTHTKQILVFLTIWPPLDPRGPTGAAGPLSEPQALSLVFRGSHSLKNCSAAITQGSCLLCWQKDKRRPATWQNTTGVS